VVHISLKNGFLKDAGLILKVESASGNYNRQMNFVNFEKWNNEKVTLNLLLIQPLLWTMHHITDDRTSLNIPLNIIGKDHNT
jgi:hypothetical protein